MSDFSRNPGTVPSADQAAAPQHHAMPVTSFPLPPSLGSSLASIRQFAFPAEPSLVQQPPVVTQPSLDEQYPVVSQLHAYTSFAPPVYSRPQPTATPHDQFRYGMPHMPEFMATPVPPPPRTLTPFSAPVLVTPTLPPQDPLQANMVDTQSDLVDHLACLMEVVHWQIYWQMRQTESLIDTYEHLQFLWENAILDNSAQTFGGMSPLWSPIQDLPEGRESDFINPSIPLEATNPYPVPRGEASSSFNPYLTPNQTVPFKKHKRIRCSKCHQKGHPYRLCPQRRNSSNAASSSGHPPPDIRTTSSSEPNITALNPPPQTMCSLCGQPAHHGNTCGP